MLDYTGVGFIISAEIIVTGYCKCTSSQLHRSHYTLFGGTSYLHINISSHSFLHLNLYSLLHLTNSIDYLSFPVSEVTVIGEDSIASWCPRRVGRHWRGFHSVMVTKTG